MAARAAAPGTDRICTGGRAVSGGLARRAAEDGEPAGDHDCSRIAPPAVGLKPSTSCLVAGPWVSVSLTAWLRGLSVQASSVEVPGGRSGAMGLSRRLEMALPTQRP